MDTWQFRDCDFLGWKRGGLGDLQVTRGSKSSCFESPGVFVKKTKHLSKRWSSDLNLTLPNLGLRLNMDLLGDGFKYVLFSPLPGEMIQFD